MLKPLVFIVWKMKNVYELAERMGFVSFLSLIESDRRVVCLASDDEHNPAHLIVNLI